MLYISLKRGGNNFRYSKHQIQDQWLSQGLGIEELPSLFREALVSAYQDKKEVDNLRGFRAPGIFIPYIICAGSFITNDGWIFCDFRKPKNTVIVLLDNEHYKKLDIEV